MLTPALLVFYLTRLVSGDMGDANLPIQTLTVHQERRVISAAVGETLTLECFYKGTESAWLFWYQQLFDQEPKLVSTFHSFSSEASFHGAFKNNKRFVIKPGNGFYHLEISNLNISDSGTYFCAAGSINVLRFAEGATVIVNGAASTLDVSINASVSGTFQRGGSVTLSCAVLTRSCDEEHNVYWLKNSSELHPIVLYGTGSDQKEPGAHPRSCVHRLPLNGLNRSHAGTYYCAVVACGHILFGNGIPLDFNREGEAGVLVYSLIGALTLSTSLVVWLSGLACQTKRRNRSQSAGARLSAPLTTITEDDDQDADDLNYAALSVRPANRSGTQREAASDVCVYSSVKK